MGTYVSVAEPQVYQIWDGAVARPLHGGKVTVGVIDFEQLTHVCEHRHENEQLGLVAKGAITMVIDGERRELRVGDMYSIRAGFLTRGKPGQMARPS
jgi:quercetin dioxygenase-like cupin family protein